MALLLASPAMALAVALALWYLPPPGAQAAQTPLSTFRVQDPAIYFGQAKLLGVTPPYVPSPAAPGAPDAGPQLDAGTRTPTVKRTVRGSANAPRRPSADSTSGMAAKAAGDITFTPLQLGLANATRFLGFNGINNFGQKYSGQGPVYGGKAYGLQPPDVALCVGNGFVVQPANLALTVYDKQGNIKAGPLHLNQFLGLLPAINGDVLSDPDCTFDKTTRRFYLTILWVGFKENNTLNRFGQLRGSGANTYGSALILAASTSTDPTKPWNVFIVPGSNDGINSNNDTVFLGGGDPSVYPSETYLQDQPRNALDATGFYFTTDVFGFVTNTFYGTNLYAMNKWNLLMPKNFTVERILIAYDYSNALDCSYHVIPAKAAGDQGYDLRNRGSMYFASTPSIVDFVGIWALTNTFSLATFRPNLKLSFTVINTPQYLAVNSPVQQLGGFNVDGSVGEMITASWARNRLWLAWNAGNLPPYDTTNGAVIASVIPVWKNISSPVLSPVIDLFQQLIGPNGNTLNYPSVSVNKFGRGIVAFAILGPTSYPSAAFAYVGERGVVDATAYLAASGTGPLTGGTSTRSTRFGDWQQVVIDEDGAPWAAVEYSNSVNNIANNDWATYVFKVHC